MKIGIIISIYNEKETIINVVNELSEICRLHKLNSKIILINDGSTDNSLELIKNLDCKIISIQQNVGKSKALHTGINEIVNHNFDFILLMDADGQHHAADIPKMIAYMNNAKLDVVIASRYIHNKGYQSSIMRRLGIKYFNLLIKCLTRKKITDSTSGFKLLNRRSLQILSKIKHNDYCEVLMIYHFLISKLTVGEIAVQMSPRQGGKSSFTYFNSISYVFYLTLKLLFYSLSRQNNFKFIFSSIK